MRSTSALRSSVEAALSPSQLDQRSNAEQALKSGERIDAVNVGRDRFTGQEGAHLGEARHDSGDWQQIVNTVDLDAVSRKVKERDATWVRF